MSYSTKPSPDIPSDPPSNLISIHEGRARYDGQAKAERASRVLGDEQPLIVPTQLACAIGLDEAIFVQQVYYWTSGPKAQVRDGHAWVYNSIDEWRKQFPFWSRTHVARVIKSVRDQGVILATDDYNLHSSDRTLWYRINSEHPAISPQPSQIPNPEYGSAKSGICNPQIPNPEQANPESGTTLPETTSETTTETTGVTPPNPPRRAADLAGFEEWWTLFPRKENKAKAREIWKRLRPSPELVATIIAQTSAYAVCDKVQRGYVMLPTTYLNGRRWEDDLAPPAPVQPVATRPGQRLTSEQIMARARLFDQEERRS